MTASNPISGLIFYKNKKWHMHVSSKGENNVKVNKPIDSSSKDNAIITHKKGTTELKLKNSGEYTF